MKHAAAIGFLGVICMGMQARGATPIPRGLDCLPSWEDPDGERTLVLGNVGGALALCAVDTFAGPVACWALDAASGKLTARAPKPFPGVGIPIRDDRCYEGLCWPAPPGGEPDAPGVAYLAYHPDGKRAAVRVGETVLIFDVAEKKPTRTFKLRDGESVGPKEITNAPGPIWFLGETVFVLGYDAGPAAAVFAYSARGKALGAVDWGVFNGAVAALDEAQLGVNSVGLSELVIAAGKTGKVVKRVRRAVAKGPCRVKDQPEWSAEAMGDENSACFKYLAEVFGGWAGVQIVRHGEGFVGLAIERGEIVTLDARLREKGRVALVRCR